MAVLVPAAAFLVWAWAFFSRGVEWRRALVFSGLGSSAFAALFTEVVSAYEGLTYGFVLGGWILFFMAGAFSVRRLRLPSDAGAGAVGLGRFWWAEISALLLFWLALLLIALVAPPNGGDSLTYHMPRIVHWIQDHHIGHYPTHVLRQLHMPPLAEIEMAHLQLLFGGDRLAASISWVHFAGLLLTCSLIAEELGGDPRAQVFAAVFAGTVPILLLQASSTKNDLVLAFHLACLAYFTLAMRRREAADLLLVVGAGASLGLALDTKGTAYPFGAAPAAMFAGLLLARFGRRSARLLVVFAAVALIFPAGQFLRNLATYQQILGPGNEGNQAEYAYANANFGLSTLVSNGIRNLAVSIGAPPWFAGRMTWFFRELLGLVGIDPDDRRTTYLFGPAFVVPGRILHESVAPCTLHLLLALIAIVAAWRKRAPRVLWLYGGAIVAGYLLYSEIFRFQVWAVRLLAPLVAAWGPFVACVLPRRRAAAAILTVAAVPWVLCSETRPLFDVTRSAGRDASILRVPREAQYFVSFPDEVREGYVALAKEIERRRLSRIGLIIGFETAEYPLWVLLGAESPDRTGIEIQHVGVENASRRYAGEEPYQSFVPQAVVVFDRGGPLPELPNMIEVGRYWRFVLFVART